MKEQIKQEIEDWAKETSPTVNSEANRLHGANHVINTYYTPLAKSHSELVEVLERIVKSPRPANTTELQIWHSIAINLSLTALSNAKKLTNEK